MRRALLPLVLLLAAASAPEAGKVRVSRAALAAVEKDLDNRIERAAIDNPFMLLGATRGVYLAGYGAVFTAELNLLTTPAISPFRPVFAKEEIATIRARKLERLGLLRRMMREMLVTAASSLDSVPPNEQVAVAISLFYYRSWEDTAGLPSQVLMQAPRQTFLDFAAGRISDDALQAAIHEQEF